MLYVSVARHDLKFAFRACTSRGVLPGHVAWYVRVAESRALGAYGLGECAPLAGLSLENEARVLADIKRLALLLADFETAQKALEAQHIWQKGLCPCVQFGAEVALMDLAQGGHRSLFANNSLLLGKSIAINGLIWMGEKAFVYQQIDQKIAEGFFCLKLKVSEDTFDEDCAYLAYIRSQSKGKPWVLRVDANGSYGEENVSQRLKILASYGVHSIEQPLPPHKQEALAELCAHAVLPIALDEGLIGLEPETTGAALLDKVKPQFIVLKPTLLGGLALCRRWIAEAEARGIGWWLTSALESNVGLSAIAQFSASLPGKRIEGLGTGGLYVNNIQSPLRLEQGHLYYDSLQAWELSDLSFQDAYNASFG